MLDERLAWARPRVMVRRLRRITSPQITFVESNHDITKTLLLVGSGRSGSTWLSEVLTEAFSCRLIFEPFRQDRVRLARNMPWGRYADPDDDDPELHRVVGRILTGRVRNPLVDTLNVYRFPRCRLVKEIRVTNLLPWIHAHFPGVPVIYLLRHPIAASWSAAQLGWEPSLDEFLRQQRLMDGPLSPWREPIARHAGDADLFHRHVLRWCLENSVPIGQLHPASAHVVFYEDLVQDPYGELRRLADYLGRFGAGRWVFDPAARPAMDRPSRTNWRDTPVMPPSERLESWVRVVPRRSVERAVALLEEVGLDRIYDASVRPRIPAVDVLRAGAAPQRAEMLGSQAGTELDLSPQPRVCRAAVVLLDIGVVLIAGEVGGDMRDTASQPAGVGGGNGGILQAVPQADRGLDVGEVELPRTEGCAPVVPPSLVVLAEPVASAYGEIISPLAAVRSVLPGPFPPSVQPPVGRGMPRDDLRCPDPKFGSCLRGLVEELADLFAEGIAHAAREVKARHSVGADRREGAYGDHGSRQPGCRSQRVGSPGR